MRWLKDAIDWIGRFQVGQWLWQNFWATLPLGWLAGTGLAGFLAGSPVMWIMVAMAASAAFVCAAMLLGNLLHIMKDPEHKLKFVGATVGVDYTENRSNAQIRKMSHANILMIIKNDATFPISAYIDSAETTIEGKQPPRTKYPKPSVLIGAGGTVLMADDAIQMQNRECGTLTGTASFIIKYGRKNQEKYELRINGSVFAPMDKKGIQTQAVLFNHLPEPIIIDSQLQSIS